MTRFRLLGVILIPAVGMVLMACSHKIPPGGLRDSGGGGEDDAAALLDAATGGDEDAAIGGRDGGVDASAGGCTSGSVMAECQSNADCDDGDPSTADSCQLVAGGEFPSGTCLHAGCDGGLSCVTQAVDPTCADTDAGVVYPPYVPLSPPDVPPSCASGFELGDASSRNALKYVLGAKTAAGARAIAADLDFATYTAPDGLQITGVDGNCKKYTLFDSCHLKTADRSEIFYTNGSSRPLDAAIRQYHVAIRQGTSELTFDFSRVASPMYVRVLGLCDFTVTQPPAGSLKWFRAIP